LALLFHVGVVIVLYTTTEPCYRQQRHANGFVVVSLRLHSRAVDAFVPYLKTFRQDTSPRKNKSCIRMFMMLGMSGGEVILHWGSGCYTAVEALMDLPVPRVLISWAARVGTDILRTTGTIQVYLGHGAFAVVSPIAQVLLLALETALLFQDILLLTV